MGIDKRSVRYGAFILTGANIASQLLGFVYRMLLSRFIGAEGMGLFQLIFPFYSLALALATSGICVAVSRLAAEYLALKNYAALRVLVRRAMGIFFVIFLVISAVAGFFAAPIAEHFLGDERTRLAVYALVPVIFFTGIENIHKNYLYGTKEVNPPAFSDLMEQIVRMSAVIGLLWIFLPQPDEKMLMLIVCGMLVCEVASSMFLRAVYRRRVRRLPEGGEQDAHLTRRMLAIAAPVSATNLVNNLLSSLIVILIPRMLAASGLTQSQALGEFGVLFGMAMPLFNLPSALIVGLGLVMVPKLSENLALGNYADLRHKVSRCILATSFAILPVLAVMTPLGAPLGWYMFGQRVDGAYLLPIAIGTAFSIYMAIFGSILNGLGKQNVSAMNFLIGNALELAMVVLLVRIPQVRMMGYVAAFVASTFLTFALNFYQVVKTCGIRVEWRRWFINPLLSAVLAGLVARISYLRFGETLPDGLALVIAILLAAVVYLSAAAAQGVGFGTSIGTVKKRSRM